MHYGKSRVGMKTYKKWQLLPSSFLVPPSEYKDFPPAEPDKSFYFQASKTYYLENARALCFHGEYLARVPGHETLWECPYSGTWHGCGWRESEAARKARQEAGVILKFPNWPLVFPIGKLPKYLPTAAQLEHMGYYDDEDIEEVRKDYEDLRAGFVTQWEADAALARQQRQQYLAGLPQQPIYPPSNVSDRRYGDEENDERLDKLIAYFKEPRGQTFLPTFVREIIELDDFLSSKLKEDMLLEMKGVGSLAHDGIPARPYDDDGKERRMDDALALMGETQGLAFVDRAGPKYQFLSSLLKSAYLRAQYDGVDWIMLSRWVDKYAHDVISGGKEATEMEEDRAPQASSSAYKAYYASRREHS